MTPSRRRRGQQISACDSCCRRKIKCNATKSKCFWCSHYRVPCTFQRVSKAGSTVNAQIAPYPQRQSSVDDTISEILHRREMTSSILDEDSHVTAIQRQSKVPTPLVDYETRSIGLLTGVCISLEVEQKWGRFKAGALVSTDMLCRDRFNQQVPLPLLLSSFSESNHAVNAICHTTLPERALIEKCAHAYMRSFARVAFPILDPDLFQETIALAYESADRYNYHVVSAKACIFGFSIFSRLVDFGSQTCSLSKAKLYTAVLQNILPTLAEVTTVDGFQACVLLTLSHLFTGRVKSAVLANVLVARFAFDLHAHTDSSPQFLIGTGTSVPYRVKQHLRNLFWVSYATDKDICLRSRQPSAFSDINCDLSLSLQYLERLSSDLETCLPAETFHPCLMFHTDIKLSQIKSRIYESLYSQSGFNKSKTQLAETIDELGTQLETWRLAVPEIYRPSLVFAQGTQIEPRLLNIRALIVQLDYYYCLTVVSHASIRLNACRMNANGYQPSVNNRMTLAAESSRYTLRYLQSSLHIVNGGIFWLVLSYPIVASVTLFCSILDNPASPSATCDYELLNDLPRLISCMSTQNVSHEEVIQGEQIMAFVDELAQTAWCAIENIRDKEEL